MKRFTSAALLLLLGGILVAPAEAQLKLNGAGATFPNVIYSKWFDVYHTKTGIEFNYQSIGSGGGIKQVTEGTVDFGASDAAMTDEQLKAVAEKQGTEVLHIPTVMGAVVVTYNLPAAGTDLKLTPEVLAGIYLGDITKWNDPALTAINPGKDLPDMPILVGHRYALAFEAFSDCATIPCFAGVQLPPCLLTAQDARASIAALCESSKSGRRRFPLRRRSPTPTSISPR